MKRRMLFWLLIVVFVWLVVSRFTEIEKLTKTLAQGKWQWVLVAAGLQAVYYVVYAALYQSATSRNWSGRRNDDAGVHVLRSAGRGGYSHHPGLSRADPLAAAGPRLLFAAMGEVV